jgi:hypothetical protein
MSPSEQEGMKHGYLAEHYTRLERAGGAPAEQVLNSPFHQQVRETLFGKEGAKDISDVLRDEVYIKNFKVSANTPDQLHETAFSSGKSIWSKSPDPAKFESDFDKMSVDEREAHRNGFLSELNRKLTSKDPADAALALKAVSSPRIKPILETMFGDKAAAEIVSAVKAEQNLAAKSKTVSAAASRSGKEPLQQPSSVHHALSQLIFRGPGAGYRNALGEILSQPAQQTAAQLRSREGERAAAQAKQENVKAKVQPVAHALAGAVGSTVASNLLEKEAR